TWAMSPGCAQDSALITSGCPCCSTIRPISRSFLPPTLSELTCRSGRIPARFTSSIIPHLISTQMSNPVWQTPSELLTLTADRVDVWFAGLDHPAHSNEKFRALLSEDEQARAAGFKFEHLRQHYT